MLPGMGRRPKVPSALTHGPFTLADAQRVGIHRGHLRGLGWHRVGPGTYQSNEVDETPTTRLEAAVLRVPPGGAFSGTVAAWLHGLEVAPPGPIEITVPPQSGAGSRSGMTVRRCELAKEEVVAVRGFPATAPARTVRDLCATASLTEAVVVADMALHKGLVTVSGLVREAERSAGSRGVRMLRRALEHVEPKSESPMETRLRMLIVLAGLPRPEAQVTIRDRFLRPLGRPDLYYPQLRLGLEYDGTIHRDQLENDNRRQNRLVDAGIRLLRFTAGDVYTTPDQVIRTVRKALAA